jgi:hypothetical protein
MTTNLLNQPAWARPWVAPRQCPMCRLDIMRGQVVLLLEDNRDSSTVLVHSICTGRGTMEERAERVGQALEEVRREG